MRDVSKKPLIEVLFVLTCLLLVCCFTACTSKTDGSSTTDAETYYNSKYGISEHVVSQKTLENNQVPIRQAYGIKYDMSDGNHVIYYKKSDEFFDDKQGEEINQAASAFVSEKFNAVPGLVETGSLYDIAQRKEDSGLYWNARYDGDIKAFLSETRPLLHMIHFSSTQDYKDESFLYDIVYEPASEEQVFDTFRELSNYFYTVDTRVLFIDAQSYEHQINGDFGIGRVPSDNVSKELYSVSFEELGDVKIKQEI